MPLKNHGFNEIFSTISVFGEKSISISYIFQEIRVATYLATVATWAIGRLLVAAKLARDSESVVFNSGQKMALRAFYFIRGHNVFHVNLICLHILPHSIYVCSKIQYVIMEHMRDPIIPTGPGDRLALSAIFYPLLKAPIELKLKRFPLLSSS